MDTDVWIFIISLSRQLAESSQMVGPAFGDLNISLDVLGENAPAGVGDEFVDDALEFAHVSRPRVLAHHVHRLRRDDCAFARAPAEVGDEQGNVFDPFAQRRDANGWSPFGRMASV